MNKLLHGNMQNAWLQLRLLFLKDFILRQEDNNSFPPGSYNAAVFIVCRAVSYKQAIDYVCLTDALWYQSHPCMCSIFSFFFFSCCMILGSVSLYCKHAHITANKNGISSSDSCTLRSSGLKHIPLRPPGVQSRAAVHSACSFSLAYQR